nr:hypothetical protein Iba_chr11aCG6080 [Ipomoea batatas]
MPHTRAILVTRELQILFLLILRLWGTEYFWATNNILFLRMWVEEKCSGMLFTMNRLVVKMHQTVKKRDC